MEVHVCDVCGVNRPVDTISLRKNSEDVVTVQFKVTIGDICLVCAREVLGRKDLWVSYRSSSENAKTNDREYLKRVNEF